MIPISTCQIRLIFRYIYHPLTPIKGPKTLDKANTALTTLQIEISKSNNTHCITDEKFTLGSCLVVQVVPSRRK